MPQDDTADGGSWWAYVQSLMDQRDWTGPDLERASGVHRSKISRWRLGETATLDGARDIAGIFGRPLLEALVAARLITASEAQQPPPAPAAVDQLSDDDLLAEVRRRMATPHIRSADVADTTRYTATPTRRNRSHSSDRA